MGNSLSFWKKDKQQEDEQPLLQEERPGEDLPTRGGLEKLSRYLGAFLSGKFPSETQLEDILRNSLSSELLSNEAIVGYGPLSGRGRQVRRDVREVIEAVLQLGMEKNYDDLFQELYHNYSRLDHQSANTSLDVQVRSDQVDTYKLKEILPNREELRSDTQALIGSARTLFSLFLTSSAFRFLLSDLFAAIREILADAAARVGVIAKNIEDQAFRVEHGLRPSGNQISHPVPTATYINVDKMADSVTADTNRHLNGLGEEAIPRVREKYLLRFEELLDRAQKSPKYRASLLTILSLSEKYYTRVYMAAAVAKEAGTENTEVPVLINSRIYVDLGLLEFLTQLKVILERLAGGKSLDSLLDHLHQSLESLASSPDQLELRVWLEDAGRYLRKALDDSGWVTSRRAHVEAERLYDRAGEVIHSDKHSKWVTGIKKVITEIEDFITALEHDKATQRLVHAFETLLADTRYIFQIGLGLGANSRQEIGREIRQDLLGWLLPRVLRFVRVIPMPRVEYTSPKLDIVVDSLVLTSTSSSLLPDHINLQVLEEIRLTMPEKTNSDIEEGHIGMSTTSLSSRFHLDGMRVTARGISYYVNYKGPAFFGWQDDGLLDIRVGKMHNTGQGLLLDLDLDTDVDVENRSLFRTKKAKLDIPGLTFRIRHSRHWISNRLLQRIAGPIVRRALSWILTRQIQRLLNATDKRMFNIYERANELANGSDESPSFWDYWLSVLEEFSGNVPAPDGEEANAGEATHVDTRLEATATKQLKTHASLTGIIHTSISQEHADSPNAPEPSTTAFSVGATEQILPGKGGPIYKEGTPADVVRDTATEMGRSVEQGKQTLRYAKGEALRTHEQVSHARAVVENTRKLERKKSGWRSNVFSI